jgi:ABC-type glucose/galactose transport system permease subunit
MARRWIPRVCALIFVAGIAGIIIATVNGNNAGVVLSIGLVITLAAVALLTLAASATNRIEVFDEADDERLEASIMALVNSGADEERLRSLVREVRRLGRQ